MEFGGEITDGDGDFDGSGDAEGILDGIKEAILGDGKVGWGGIGDRADFIGEGFGWGECSGFRGGFDEVSEGLIFSAVDAELEFDGIAAVDLSFEGERGGWGFGERFFASFGGCGGGKASEGGGDKNEAEPEQTIGDHFKGEKGCGAGF